MQRMPSRSVLVGMLGSGRCRGVGTSPSRPPRRKAIPVILRQKMQMASKWEERHVERLSRGETAGAGAPR